MKILEFDKDFIEYENRLKAQKKMAIESQKASYKVKQTAYGFLSAVCFLLAIASLIVIGWAFS